MTTKDRSLPVLLSLLYCLVCLASLGGLTAADDDDDRPTLVVFIPTSCSRHDYGATVSVALADSAAVAGAPQAAGIAARVYDSCQPTPQTLQRIAAALLVDHRHSALVGPGQRALCEVATRFLADNNRAVFSWACVGDDVTPASVAHRTFARTGASARSTAHALADLLRHFRWKFVALVLATRLPSSAFAAPLRAVMTQRGFVVTETVYVTPTTTAADLVEHVSVINHTTKAIVLCVSAARTTDVLLALRDVGLLRGPHAVFVVPDASSYLSPGGALQGDAAPLAFTAARLADRAGGRAVARELLGPVFVLSPSAAGNTTTAARTTTAAAGQEYSENLYNAIRLASHALSRVHAAHLPVSDGRAVIDAARNTTFGGFNGQLSTDARGEVVMRFVLWHYSGANDTYVRIREVDPATGSVGVLAGPIVWPNGRLPPPPDMCEFESCTTSVGLGSLFVIAIIAVVLVACCLAIAVYIRRRMALRAMQTGPNKMLLYAEDLTFITRPLNKVEKGSIVTDPSVGNCMNSSRSLSDKSFVEYVDIGDTARYNGDLVYVKQLHIKSFEMSGAVRLYIKQLRDVRHANLVAFIGCFINPGKPAFIWEYCSRKSLEDVIHNENIKLDWDFKLSLLTDLVKGMKYIHSTYMKCHGALKSGNCVIDSRWVLKLTDFGITGIYRRFKCRRERQDKDLLWTAPELLRSDDIYHQGTPQADVYSFAIIMQEVIIRGYPFCMLDLDASEIIRKVRKPPPLCRPSVSQQMAPPQYIQIMKQCWAEKRQMRPDFNQIHHDFKKATKGKKMNIVDTMFKMLEKYSNDLEDIVRQRTVALEEEKKKTENLLSQMLPPSVAASLLRGEPVEAESFSDVTIYFSDIVGFTTISAMSTPIEVVNLLNDLYTMFDATIDDYDVYKVETIGDAYMVASGLPVPNGLLHAGEIGTMALDLLSQCGQFTIRHMPDVPLRLRIGLHTGHCVSGVVGLRMPRYCLFGDTINTASRMESTGFAFRIHVSESTKQKLDILGGYHTEFRGEVELKGRGRAKTYWLTGKDGFSKPLPLPPDSSASNHGLELLLNAKTVASIELQNTEAPDATVSISNASSKTS